MTLEDRGRAGGVVGSVDDLDRQPNRVRRGQTQGRALVQADRVRGAHVGPDLADRLGQERPAGAEVGFGVADVRLDHRLIAEQPGHHPRGLGAGELRERFQAGASQSQGNRGIARGEQQRPGDPVERPGLQQLGRGGQDGALRGHEDIVHGEVVSPGAAHAAHVPGVGKLGFGDRDEEVAPLRLSVHLQSEPAVLDDLSVRGHPRGMPATGAEALAAGDPVAARDADRRSARGRTVGDDAARRVDPDRASDVARHSCRVGREDGALVDRPGGARVRLAELLDHLDVGRQVELGAPEGAWQRQVEQPGGRQRLEERPRELPCGLDLVGAGPDLRSQLLCGVERRLGLGGTHGSQEYTRVYDPVPMMRIEIICTGDEVLTGKIVNTNFSYISQKLEDVGLSVRWETTVGDDRESLLRALRLAGERADAVIVNGGLGPTVDDLSQEVAAQAADVELVLNDEWLARMEEFFRRRSRVMPPNNRKQAMLPATAELIDNPIGTACGFALDVGGARFFFTPGVPRELRRMLEEEIIPRLLAKSGLQPAIHLKRFHSYGLGESHVDALLRGVDELVPDGGVKLGFRAHYPQLETKLTVRGTDMEDVRRKLAPVEREVRKRLGNFILSEGDATLEGVVLNELAQRRATLSTVETFTSGAIAARLAHLPDAERVFRRGVVARDLGEVCAAVGLDGARAAGELTRETAETVARAAQRLTGATHALAVLIELDGGADRIDLGGTVWLAIATSLEATSQRRRILAGREWGRQGAVELGLDCLRRYLQGLPVNERIDFEKV